jgi:hypothetical protein
VTTFIPKSAPLQVRARSLEIAVSLLKDYAGHAQRTDIAPDAADVAHAAFSAAGVAAGGGEDDSTGVYLADFSNGRLDLVRLFPSDISAAAAPSKRLLRADAASFVLATGRLYVWIGPRTSRLHRAAAMHAAKSILGPQQGLEVHRVVAGAEPTVFKALFAAWDGVLLPADARLLDSNVAGRRALPEDFFLALARAPVPPFPACPPPTGRVRAFRVTDGEVEPVPPQQLGHLWRRDVVVALADHERAGWAIYVWQGAASSPVSFLAYRHLLADALTVAVQQARGGIPKTYFVREGEETAAFLNVFAGFTVLHAGGRSRRYLRGIVPAAGPARLFRVARPAPGLPPAAAEVRPFTAAALCSRSSYILTTSAPSPRAFVWAGAASAADLAQAGFSLAVSLLEGMGSEDAEPIVEVEAAESEEFLALLPPCQDGTERPTVENGGVCVVPTTEGPLPFEPRLYTAGDFGGLSLRVCDRVTRRELHARAVLLLDAGASLFLWVGEKASTEIRGWLETVGAPAYAAAALQLSASGELPRCIESLPIISVSPGLEPAAFTACFFGWVSDSPPNSADPGAERQQRRFRYATLQRALRRKQRRDRQAAMDAADDAEGLRLAQELAIPDLPSDPDSSPHVADDEVSFSPVEDSQLSSVGSVTADAMGEMSEVTESSCV